MCLVKEHALTVPIPDIYGWYYRFKDEVPAYGELAMEFMPGRTLKSAWAELDVASKQGPRLPRYLGRCS